MVASCRIGTRRIGDREPCFIIAEAGSNHNGRLDQAIALIDVARDAGADAVKFQVFRARTLYPRGAGISRYLKVAKSIYDVIEEMEMPREWLAPLAAHCSDRGILFMASVFDEASADALDPYVAVFKIASYEMTHIPMVRHVAAKRKPIVMSTGTATLDEVRETVNVVSEAGAELMLMQCTAAYPAPPDSLNIRALTTLKEVFRVPVGFSDHSRDPLIAPVCAVGAGANLLEKHFTLSNELAGPDHRFAVEPKELGVMIQAVRQAETALGSGDKVVQEVERELRAFARRSIFAVRDIAVGEPFTRENVAVLRCGELPAGLHPRDLSMVLGRHAASPIAAESAIHPHDLA